MTMFPSVTVRDRAGLSVSTGDDGPRRPAVFVGSRVRLDEGRWSPQLAGDVAAWASAGTVLVVTDGGNAMVLGPDLPLLDPARDDRSTPPILPHGSTRLDQPRSMELCAIFRFGLTETASMPTDRRGTSASTDPDTRAVTAPGIVQLAPEPLFHYLWRRRALALNDASPHDAVEGDAVALLRHVRSQLPSHPPSRASSTNRPARGGASPARARHRALARDAKVLLTRAIADPHPIAQVARTLGSSPFHMARVFRAETSMSPHEYLVQRRIAAAITELRAGVDDLSMLALELGFSHHSHFSAVFREVTGYAPRDARRMLTAQCRSELGARARRCS